MLAWAGHIASRHDWGDGNAAVNIPGSPFHTRLIALDGSGGNQDRSLSNDAVTFPATITIIKQATPEGATSFPFTASPSPLSNFNLVDDGTSANTKVFSNITNFQVYTVAESVPATWSLTSISCSVTDANSGTQTVSLPSVAINLKEGESVTCTFTNRRPSGSIKIVKQLVGGISGQSYTFDFTPVGFGANFSLTINTPNGSNESSTYSSLPTSGTTYSVSETAPSGWTQTSATCTSGTPANITVTDGGLTTCTFTNTEDQNLTRGKLVIKKVFDPLTSGFSGSFSIPYSCTDGTGGTATLAAGGQTPAIAGIVPGSTCTVTEPTLPTAPASWTFGAPTFSSPNPVTITAGTTSEVTVTNTITRDQGYLKISKIFDPLTSGFAGSFEIVYNCGAGNVTATLAAGGSTTVGPFNTGASCTVTEPTLPAAPTGWTFGTPSVSGSPATITKGDQAAAVAVSVTNTISRDKGYLKISKVFDPLTSGFSGNFSINYNCGAGDVAVSLAAGGSTTVGPFNTGLSCTVSEPSTPTAPTGWTFGTPSVSGSPATIVKGDAAAAVAVTVTNTITRDQGYLKISKIFDAKTSGFAGNFSISYNCGAGAVTVSLAAGGSTTAGPFNTGTSCTVSEPSTPTAPTGWTFGTPSVSGSPATIVKGDAAAAVAVNVTNTITRDLGNFKITKTTSNPNGATLPAAFSGTYNCGTGYTGNWSVANGASQTINNIPTGNSCTVSETAPAPITGYTWGAVTYTPTSITISAKDGTFEIVVGNSITRDLGNFKITKTTTNPDSALLPAAFSGTYNCGAGYTGNWSVANGASQTITNIPTGNSCSVSETAPAGIPGYTWGAVTYTPTSITISAKDGTFEIVVRNSITRDKGTIVVIKNAKPAQGSFAFTTTGTGYAGFTLTGATTGGGNQNSQLLPTGSYSVKESTQLGWILTGIGGLTDLDGSYHCVVAGSGGSTGTGRPQHADRYDPAG